MTKVVILGTEETRGENELCDAYRLAGGESEAVPLAQVKQGTVGLAPYSVVVLPDGMTPADAVGIKGHLEAHAKSNRMILGIGSGFEALLEIGLLPCPSWSRPLELEGHEPRVRLERNACGGKIDTTARVRAIECLCLFTLYSRERSFSFEIETERGQIACDERTLRYLGDHGLIAFRYEGRNPTGSPRGIAGICSPGGNILGLIARPEIRRLPPVAFLCPFDAPEPPGFPLFQESVRHAPPA